ncbi:hypothetical protein OG21DRAFT_306943 [Imleria badia]|nr:hypothetical protein OG21DRAFT_306943 [Imleria badia]
MSSNIQLGWEQIQLNDYLSLVIVTAVSYDYCEPYPYISFLVLSCWSDLHVVRPHFFERGNLHLAKTLDLGVYALSSYPLWRLSFCPLLGALWHHFHTGPTEGTFFTHICSITHSHTLNTLNGIRSVSTSEWLLWFLD